MSWFRSLLKLTQRNSKFTGLLGRLLSFGNRAMSKAELHKFTPRFQIAVSIARAEAKRLNHPFAGTEHLLFGVLLQGEGVGLSVLQMLRVDLAALRLQVERSLGVEPNTIHTGNPAFTGYVKKALARAARAARELNHSYVGTEHLLLGMMDEGSSAAAQLLAQFNLHRKGLRDEILKISPPGYVETKESLIDLKDLKFSPNAQQALKKAFEEAQRFKSVLVEQKHVLLGVASIAEGMGYRTLSKLGVIPKELCVQIEREMVTGPADGARSYFVYSRDGWTILTRAAAEAKALNRNCVGTEHMLLALLREKDGVAARVLAGQANVEQVTREISKEYAVASSSDSKDRDQPHGNT